MMNTLDPWSASAAALALGLAGGVSPGPLSALVIQQTLRHGTREGLKVSLAPILTDMPLLLASSWLAVRLAELPLLLAGLSLLGGLLLLGMARAGWEPQPLELEPSGAGADSLLKAILTNLLNPNPYLFWVAIGGPLLARAWEHGPLSALSFLAAFFGSLCGSKILIAVAVGRARTWLTGAGYQRAQKLMAGVMALLGLLLLTDAAQRLSALL